MNTVEPHRENLLTRIAVNADLSGRIHDAIHHSPALSECEIAVVTTGSDVVLSGKVRISLQKRLANTIAQRFGSRTIRNDILVG